jgi:hypothetical protein
MGDCIFSRMFKDKSGKDVCAMPNYFDNGKYRYLPCEGNLGSCFVEHGDLVKAMENYWDSDERVTHENLMRQAKAENGIRRIL